MKKFLYPAALLFLLCSTFQANAQKPTTAASNISFSNVFCNQLQLNWTNGNGTERLVLARKGALINSFPIDDSVYFAHDTLGKGKKLGSNNYVVYSGTGSSTTVYGLDTNSKYYFAVFEFIQSGSNYYYLTTNYPESNTTTEKINANFIIDIPYQCIGGNSFKFTNLSTNSLGQPMTYLWNFGDDSISSVKDPTHTHTKPSIHFISLTSFSQGCVGKRIRTDTAAPISYANFVLDTLAGNDSMHCPGDTLKFHNRSLTNSIAGTPIDETSYIWSFGDNTKTFGYNSQKKFSKGGIYEIKLVTLRRVTNNGLVPYCRDSISKMFKILDGPDARFSRILSGKTVSYTSLSNDSSIIHSWDFGDGDTSSQPNPTHVFKANTVYNVCHNVINSIGCKDKKCDTLNLKVGIEEINHNLFSVYPNPTTGVVQVQFKNPTFEACLSVYNLVGDKVFHLEDINQKNIAIDLSQLGSGVYFLRINGETGMQCKRFF